MSDPTQADSTAVAPEEIVPPVAAPVAEASVVEAPAPVIERNEATFTAPPTLEDRVPVGSTFTRTAFGWSVKIMYGGALRMSGDGATIDAALTDAGR